MIGTTIITVCLSGVLLLAVFGLGYVVGTKIGIDSAVPYALKLAGIMKGDLPDDPLANYLKAQADALMGGQPRRESVRDKLANDEEYQRQLREQAGG